jgi:chemotaxis signal transduction protein
LETHYIFQVVHEAAVSPVPFVPECYLGLTYFRGEIFDVIDIGSLLGVGNNEIKQGRKNLILIKWSDKKWALAPDRSIGLVYLDSPDEAKKFLIRKNEELNVVTPEMVMDRLLKENYGPIKI